MATNPTGRINGNTNESTMDEDLARPNSSGQSTQPAMPQIPTSGSSVTNIPFTPIENIMGSYDQSTYHISWVLVDDVKGNQAEIVIAESGSTELNIKDLSITSVMGANSISKNVTTTRLVMKLSENMGSNLPDRMFAAAKKLQIKNYTKAPWKIRLRFHGYDATTGKAVPNIAGMTWEWPVTLLDIQTKIDETGSSHVVNMVPAYEVAQFNQYFRTAASFSVEAGTVGGVLTGLIDAMNAHIRSSYNYQFITYKIIDRPYQTAFNNMISSPFGHKIGEDRRSVDPYRYPMGSHISQGTAISDILDGLMAASPTAVQMATTTRDNNQRGLTESTDLVSTFHRLLMKVELGAYNDIVNDYEKVITFIVQPYESLRMISSVADANSDKSVEMYRNRAKFAMSRNYLKKEYNYIFTGKNTEVLKFDIDVNFMWNISAAKLLGSSHTGSQTIGQAFDPRQALENLQNTRDALNSNNQAKADLTRLETRPESRVMDTVLENANNRVTTTAEILEESRRVGQQDINDMRVRQATHLDDARQRREEFNRYTSSNIRVFSDDLITTNADFNPLPITVVLDTGSAGGSYGAMVEENVTRQRSIYGLLLNQLYGANGMDGNLQDIRMEIKGDPYWLGTMDYTANQYGDTVVELKSNRLSSPNFVNGEYMFVLRFNIPQGYRDDGSPILNQDNLYSGFYRCIEVNHNFSNGQFTQTLQGSRIPGWTIKTVLGG